MRAAEPVVLTGHGVRLEPLSGTHAPDLLEAASDPAVWRWLPVPQPTTPAEMATVVTAAVSDRDRVPFAVVVNGRAVGSTSYLDIDVAVGGLEIGWTWYSPAVWRTHVNPACKLLLLSHAFDALGADRVLLKTDGLNSRSQGAIRRLGARYDGTLRHHRLRPDGTVRDTACFSILSAEWPAARAGLEDRLGAADTGSTGQPAHRSAAVRRLCDGGPRAAPG